MIDGNKKEKETKPKSMAGANRDQPLFLIGHVHDGDPPRLREHRDVVMRMAMERQRELQGLSEHRFMTHILVFI
jgi:hypothetical protein